MKLLTSDDPEMSCGIGFLSVTGIPAAELAKHLLEKHRILVVSTGVPGEYEGVRVTPNVYTTVEEIDTFAEVMEKIIRRGKIA